MLHAQQTDNSTVLVVTTIYRAHNYATKVTGDLNHLRFRLSPRLQQIVSPHTTYILPPLTSFVVTGKTAIVTQATPYRETSKNFLLVLSSLQSLP